MKIFLIEHFPGDGSMRTYYRGKDGNVTNDLTEAAIHLSQDGITLGHDEDWIELDVPEPDPMKIIRKEVQKAIDKPHDWCGIREWEENRISPVTRKIAAIKCLRSLCSSNPVVMTHFKSNYIGLADAKNFVETHFSFPE